MENKNRGILIREPRATDWILGSEKSISSSIFLINHSLYLPDNENQYNSQTDFLDCTTASGMHGIETMLNYYWKNGLMSDEFKNFLHRSGYIQNDKIKLSIRFSAKMNGTDLIKGQYQNVAGDHFRSDGFLADMAWPVTSTMTWEQYYSVISDNYKQLAKRIKWFIDVNYQWIPRDQLSSALPKAPIQVATEVCDGWDSGNVVPKCSGKPIQHATLLYGIDGNANWLDFDQYPPYMQKLASDYELNYNMQYIVSLKPLCLRQGMNGMNVLKLQQNLVELGYSLSTDGVFGPHTESALMDFQKKNGLNPDGIAGPITLQKIVDLLKPSQKSKIDLWCEAIKEMEGSKPEWNNPGNLEFHSQPGTIGQAGRFAIFSSYEDGYNALRNLLISAASGHSSIYDPNGSLYSFYAIYAPDNDGNNSHKYAEFVAEHIGVSPTVAIKSLLA